MQNGKQPSWRRGMRKKASWQLVHLMCQSSSGNHPFIISLVNKCLSKIYCIIHFGRPAFNWLIAELFWRSKARLKQCVYISAPRFFSTPCFKEHKRRNVLWNMINYSPKIISEVMDGMIIFDTFDANGLRWVKTIFTTNT